MTGEQIAEIRDLIHRSPRTIWGYLPFVIPTLVVVVGVFVIVAEVAYFERKAPDLQVLFKLGSKVEPVMDSHLVREMITTTSGSITVTFMMFAFLARIAFKQVTLLRILAKELGIVDAQQGGATSGSQPIRSETTARTPVAGSSR